MADDFTDADVTQGALEALLVQMIRNGTIPEDQVLTAADTEQAGGTAFDMAVAHQLRTMVLEANAPSVGDWVAQQRRSQIHIVKDRE
jgi:hypothetical protein